MEMQMALTFIQLFWSCESAHLERKWPNHVSLKFLPILWNLTHKCKMVPTGIPVRFFSENKQVILIFT